MGKRLPKNKKLDKLDKKLDAVVDKVVEELEPAIDKVADELADAVMEDPKPQEEMVKIVALQNWVLDGEFISEGMELDISSELAGRLLTHTSAFRLAG